MLAGLAFGAIGAPPASALTPTVTNLNDSGTGSLRAALGEAEPGDTVQFASGLSGTIELDSVLQFSGGDLNLVGNGAVTIDGQHGDRDLPVRNRGDDLGLGADA